MTVYIVEFKAFCAYDLTKAEAHAESLAAEGTCVITPYEVL